jgi:hypothetical protein
MNFTFFCFIEQEHSAKTYQETPSPDSPPIHHRSCFKKCFDKIYQWDEHFLFSTMIVYTYTINFIILFYLTMRFIFLYTTRMMSPISFMTTSLEQILNIG